jgi:hypothetical protein
MDDFRLFPQIFPAGCGEVVAAEYCFAHAAFVW